MLLPNSSFTIFTQLIKCLHSEQDVAANSIAKVTASRSLEASTLKPRHLLKAVLSSSMSGPSANKKFVKYNVFLNHRGPDTKNQFVIPLESKLREASIEPFLDKHDIQFGEHVPETIDEALRTASMHIAIFSKKYAESVYCLSELLQMLTTFRPILIVFYDVEPEHVRRPLNPHGPYAKAFKKHGKRHKPEDVARWVNALETAAELKGFIRADFSDDEELAREIVKEVKRNLKLQTVEVGRRGGQYHWNSYSKLHKEGQGILIFTANTNTDLHIAFSPEADIKFPMYEIVIGAWENSASVIRRQIQGRSMCRVNQRLAADVNQFWISINAETQFILVGRGNQPCQEDAFIIYKDPIFLSKVQYFSFSSWNTAIKYTIDKVEPIKPTLNNSNQNFREFSESINQTEAESKFTQQPILIQPTHGHYDWSKYFMFLTAGRGFVSFAAKTVTDVHVAISPQPQTMDPMYEIVIGGWGNTESVIRRKSQGEILSCVGTVGVINSHVLNRFWVSIDANTQLIHVGQGNQPNLESVFCIYKDVNFINEARCISFSSWDTPVSYYVASPSPFLSSQYLKIPQQWGTYIDWSEHRKLPAEGRGIVSFAAKTSTDVHIAISPEPRTMDPMYEVVIGGWNNSQSVIRRQSQGMNLCSTHTDLNDPHIGPNWSHFWVSIDAKTRVIRVGRGKQAELDSSVLCIYKDPNFISQACYVSFSSWDVPVTYSEITVASIHSST